MDDCRYAHSDIETRKRFGTKFELLSEEEQKEWYEAYDAYVERITALKARGFHLWITDFGFRI